CSSQVLDFGVEEEAEANAAAQPARGVWVMTDDQFDQWVFGGPRNSKAGRNKLDSLLALQVDDVARMCPLSEVQKKKLLLAGRGDIKRFFDKVEEKRKKFEKVKQDQTKIGEIYQELVPLKVELAVAQLDQTVGFRDEQRRRLVELILSETQPPTRFGQYDYYLVMYQAGQIAEAKLKPLFEDRQWALLNRQLNQMRGMQQFLQDQGLLHPLKVVHPPRRRAEAG